MVKQKGSGWHNESRRHSLARRGIKTTQKIPVMHIKKNMGVQKSMTNPNLSMIDELSNLQKEINARNKELIDVLSDIDDTGTRKKIKDVIHTNNVLINDIQNIKKEKGNRFEKIFSFDELPKDVQEKVIEKQRETEMENYGNVEIVTEDMTEYLEDMGVFDKENLFWDASQSQGDYVSFDTKDVDWEMFMKFHKFNKEDIAFIKKLDSKDKLSMGYKDGEIWFDEDDLTDKETGKLRNIAISLENKFRDVKRTLLKNAYSYYDSIQEEDYLKETIEANDYKFLADGRMV